MERACAETGTRFDRKPLWASLLYALVTFRRTPVILVNGRLASHGRVPTPDEVRGWIGVARIGGEQDHRPVGVSRPAGRG